MLYGAGLLGSLASQVSVSISYTSAVNHEKLQRGIQVINLGRQFEYFIRLLSRMEYMTKTEGFLVNNIP